MSSFIFKLSLINAIIILSTSEILRIPGNSSIQITNIDLNFRNTKEISFAINTEFSGVIFQQPEYITITKDFFQIALTENGFLQLKWKYKGENFAITSTNVKLNDGKWHVLQLKFTNQTLSLFTDASVEAETLTSVAETPTLFVLRNSQQDSNVVIGSEFNGQFCVEFGKPFGDDQFWNATGDVFTHQNFQENCSGMIFGIFLCIFY